MECGEGMGKEDGGMEGEVGLVTGGGWPVKAKVGTTELLSGSKEGLGTNAEGKVLSNSAEGGG